VPSEFHWEGQGGPDDSVSFDMKFNYIRFHQLVNRQIKGHLYAGIGYHLDRYYAIDDEDLKLDTSPPLTTPHYFYSENYDYDTSDYTMSGLSLNFVYDSRDSQINPYEGYYVNINYRYYFSFLGSDQDASHLLTEFRTYVGLSKKMPRHLIAFWLFSEFNLTGDMPYLTLPALGGDQRARSGRGYVNGRYRGKNFVYGEVEWRFPISQCSKILGGVVFVNATTTDYPLKGVGLFEFVQPAVGFGVRVMVNKHFRTNINLDFAIGNNSQGFYFSGQETF
jgi:outer membrane protein assembly factor BamA